jgi:GNAT superfamily N-acetyltransferase
METQPVLELSDAPGAEDAEFLRRALTDFNRTQVADDEHRLLRVFLRDGDGELTGGLLGGTYWNWLYVEILWIAAEYRKRGYGRSLLAAAEREAVHRGCLRAHLDTHDFQAVEFYRKQGYIVAGKLEDLPPGHTRYLLKKDLYER